MPTTLPVFHRRLVKRSRMFYKQHRRPLCRYRSPAINSFLPHQHADPDHMEEHVRTQDGCVSFLPLIGHRVCTRGEFENRAKGIPEDRQG